MGSIIRKGERIRDKTERIIDINMRIDMDTDFCLMREPFIYL